MLSNTAFLRVLFLSILLILSACGSTGVFRSRELIPRKTKSTIVDSCAIEVLDRINPLSIKMSWEYGGRIYVNDLGEIYATWPFTERNSHTVMIYPLAKYHIKGLSLARYHTHGAETEEYDEEEFSEPDTINSRVDMYLETPSYRILKFDCHFHRVFEYDRKLQLWIRLKGQDSSDWL